MKNKFEIIGDTVEILLNPKSGLTMKAIISKEDLWKAQEFSGTWCPGWQGFGYYVKGREPRGNGKILLLHRVLTDCPDGLVVDHLNHNTLDNRRDNLKVCTQAENCKNRRAPTRKPSPRKYKSKLGVVGVRPQRRLKQETWLARISVNGKAIYLGCFKKLEDAINARKEAELKYYQ